MTALTPRPVRAPRPKQSAADRQAVYRDVEIREGGRCLALSLDPAHICEGPIQRHHAGLSIGMAKITDRYHVTLLCRGANVGAWARVHDREVMAEIARRQNLREHVHAWQWSIHDAMEWCACGESRPTLTEQEMEYDFRERARNDAERDYIENWSGLSPTDSGD